MTSKILFLSILSFLLLGCEKNEQQPIQFAENVVVAHRGAWKTDGLPKNSIAALKRAIELGCTGSEFDVRMTKDTVLIVTHDPEYGGLNIEETNYAELAKTKLPNGEVLPTLKEFIQAGMADNTTTGLVCELKPSDNADRNKIMALKAVQLVEELKAEAYLHSYISFGYDILKEIHELNPTVKTQYLTGDKSPLELKTDGITGLDYHYNSYLSNNELIPSAREHNLSLNAWTVNDASTIDWLIANDFDFITTDEPELAFERVKKHPSSTGYELVWGDEFNYIGKPDSTKWAFEKGLVRNQEAQYYTDELTNARVADGMLIMTAVKEQVKNESFESTEHKRWQNNREFAEYTAPSLTTKGKAAWTYGRIEVRAKLPEGRGLWPAFWMLGEDFPEVAWPTCGEIDIMEHVGHRPDSIFSTIHTEAYNHMKGTHKGKKIFIDQPYDSFHVFAVEWTPKNMQFFLDDAMYNEIENENKTTAEWPFDDNFFLKLNIAVGGMLGGREGIDDEIFPAEMLVDYVRVYQKTDK